MTALCCRVSSMNSHHLSVSGEKSLVELPEKRRRIPGTHSNHPSIYAPMSSKTSFKLVWNSIFILGISISA